MSFLKKYKSFINQKEYLQTARAIAKKHGYDPEKLSLSENPMKKLTYDNIDFGSSINKDFIIYSSMENGEPEKHRKRYLARATKIKGNWKSNPYSRNNLAIKILWNGFKKY